MRALAYSLLFFGLCLLGLAAYDELRGVAHLHTRRSRLRSVVVTRAMLPEVFHEVMINEWTLPAPFMLGGLILLGLVRNADRSDPFSPELPENAAPDEGTCAFDETLEKKRRLLP